MSFYDRLLYEAMLERHFLWVREDDDFFPRWQNTEIRPPDAERRLMKIGKRRAARGSQSF